MESTKNMKNTSKPKFTLIAKNVIPSSPEQGLYSSMISSFTNESIKKPMLLPSIKGNKKNNNILISTQIKQMKSISQRISSNGFGVNGFNIRNIKSKTKQKTNKTSKTKTIFKKINNNNIVTYITVKCMGKVAENCAKYLTTGSQVLVEGKLRLDQWKDKKTNQNRQMLYLHADIVTFLEKPQANNQILTNNDNPPHGYDDDPVF